MSKITKPKKVLVLGSGALKIGEAGEFDFSGSQALKALKEEGVKTVLINPNIATIQTSKNLADKIYFLPVQPFFVEKVIKKEKPDGLLLSFGGQTALNCGVELYKSKILEKNNVRVLGTPVKTIMDSEDRDLFVKKLDEINLKTPKSCAVTSVDKALVEAKKIGYPVMMRTAYSLGGQGSGVAKTPEQLKDMAIKAFTFTPQILVEEWLGGWKEIEYEVVRDSVDNCITVCNMENFDPLGIHTGESIVIAPSQTLTNHEYHKLRKISIDCIRHLGVIGECNIQFALNPENDDYRIIEVNARLSRSSALASKATGYPLAFVAAKLALGYSLVELKNSVTHITKSCFEPALDYCVVKIPRWDLDKFKEVSRLLGSGMKSVGEVMAIGRKFEEALQKAIRMLDIGKHGIVCNKDEDFENIKAELQYPTDKRLYAITKAFKSGLDVDKLHDLTKIDKWFLYKIRNIVDVEEHLVKHKKDYIKNKSLSHSDRLKDIILLSKKLGFSDKQLSIIFNISDDNIREYRVKHGIRPVVKQIDTLAAEYPAKTNYLYLTYNGEEDDVTFNIKNNVIVLGSGTYRIGSSVEFDWCCVNAVFTLKDLGYSTIMLNYNPETVSTDYDICDRLYFDEISFESVFEIDAKENPLGIIVSMGGQIANNIALRCHNNDINILGTSPLKIDNAEDRHKFSSLLDSLEIDQPDWKELTSISEAKKFADKVSYPVLVRPSYVLSGAAMAVALNEKMLEQILKKAADVSSEHPVVISKFIDNAKEIEIDAVGREGVLIDYAISEHIEYAGVHSGDATVMFPTQRTYFDTVRKVEAITRNICKSLEITGPFNIQFIAKHNEIKVIECNLRASRSFPFVSKVKGINLIDLATRAIMKDKELDKILEKNIDRKKLKFPHLGIKAPQFSFGRLQGADPMLSVEMSSTGEVACLGHDLYDTFLKSVLSAGMKYPKKSVLLSISGDKNRYMLWEDICKLLELDFKIFATESTSEFLRKNDIPNKMLYKLHEKDKNPNIRDYMLEDKIGLVINIPRREDDEAFQKNKDKYHLRRLAVDLSIPLITNMQIAKIFIQAISAKRLEDLDISSWDEYVK